MSKSESKESNILFEVLRSCHNKTLRNRLLQFKILIYCSDGATLCQVYASYCIPLILDVPA